MTNRFIGGYAQVGVFPAPLIVEQADSRRQHLRASLEQRIVEGTAYVRSLMDGGNAAIGIDQAKGPHETGQRAHLSSFEAGLSGPRCCRFVSSRGLSHCAKRVMSIADKLENFGFQFGSGMRINSGNELESVLQNLNRIAVGKSCYRVVCGKH